MPPEKKKYKVSRQSLADFSATVEAKPNLSEEELFAKFPEFNSDRDLLQSALDYHTTKKSGKYKTDQELDAKFPEFEFEAPTPQDTENMVRQFAQEQQRNKKGYAIDKKFEPEIKSWIDNEVSTARSLAQAEFNTWSKAREQQLKAKGLQGEALEMALSKEQGSKLDEINKRLDTDLSTKYKSKLEEFENLTLNAPPKASATATMAPKKDAGVFASFGKQIANVFANTLPGSVAAMTAAELPSTLDEWKVGGRRSPNFNKSINHLIEDKSRFGEKDDPVDRAMLNSLKRTKDFLGKDNYNDSLYDPQSKEAMFADFFKEEIRKEKQNLLAEAKKQKEEAGELLKDVPTSWDDAKKAGNISGYVSGAIGQGLGTTGIALATAGVGAFVLEAGEIYQEANAEKAKYLSKIWGVNVTPEDVVLYGEDTDSRNAARIGGVINAGLEFLGGKLGLSKFAKAMVGKKIVGNLVSSGVMGAGGEGATELVQEMVNIIAARTAGKNPDLLQSRDWDRLIESARQGAIAGGTFASVGSTVSQANEKVQEIGNLIDQVGLPGMEYTQLQNQIFSDAVQKQAAGQVPIQSGAGSSQKMAQGEPQSEPQSAAQAGQAQTSIAPKELDTLRLTDSGNVSQTGSPIQNYTFSTPEGGQADGTIAGEFAFLRIVDSGKDTEGLALRGTNIFGRLLSKLVENGVTTIQTNMQTDKMKSAIQKMIQMGALTPVLDSEGNPISIEKDGSPTRLTINKDVVASQVTPQAGLTFTTERGSVYTVDGQRTTRNKAQREGQEDFGPKPQSFATVYLTPEDAQRAQIIYTGGVQSRTIDRQGDEVVVTDVLDNGSIKTTKFPYQKTPQVGLHPFEVFEDGGAHLGNKITSISGQPVATPSGIKEAQTTQTIPDQVQVEEPTGGTTEDKLQPFSKVKQRQVRDLEKADETTFTEKGRQIIDRAFESGLIDEQQSRSLSALLNNASGKNATPRSRKQFFDALRTDLKLPVDQRTNQIKARIADIKSKILGMRMEKKITKARLAEVKSVTDPMFKDLDIPSSKAKRAMKRILGTNFGSDLQVERLAGYLTDLARGIEADMIYDEAEQAKAALQKSKGKAISNLTPAIDKILKLDIRNVEDLGEYIDNVKNILNGLNPAKKGYAPTNEAQAIQYAEKAFAQESNAKRERLTDLGIPTEGVADEDLDGILSFAEEKDILPTKGDQHRQHLEQQFEYSALAIEELADELAEKGDNKLKKIIAIDPASFNSNKDLAMAIRVLDYIAQNGYDPKVGVGNLGVLEAKIELDEAIPKMPKLEGASLPNLTVNFIDTVRAKGFMQALRRLAGTVETATKLSVLAGFNERMQSAAKASGVVAKATRAMEDVFDAAKKAGYKLNTVPAVRRTNMIGMLLSYPEGANKYAYFDRMKANLAQSLETMKDDPKSSKFYDDDKKALDEFAKIPNRDEFEAHVNKKYPWEMKLLATGQGVLAERFSDFAKKSLEYFNEYVGKQEGYFGSFRFKRRMPLPNDAQIRSTSKPRSANSAIQRQYTIDRDAYYDLNFTENVLRTLKEQSDVIDTAHGQTKSNMFLKDPRAVEILGGTENYAKINQIYKGMSDAFLGKGAHHEGNYTLWSKAATLGGDAIRAFVFSGVPAFVKGIKYFHTRYWKQFMPTIMNSTVQMAMKKPESVKFLFTHIPPNLKLLEDKPIKLRSRVLGGLAVDNMDFGTSVINFEAQFLDRWNAQIKKVLALTSAGQIEGDVDSVTRNWIAYYLEYLDSKGIKDAKLEEEHLYDDDVRKEAAAYAQNMVDLVHGESQTETAGLWYRDPNAAIKLLKIIAFPFSGFMMKQKDRLADNIAIMKDPSTSKVAKTEAFRDSMAIASENVTFATMAVAIRAMFEVGSVAAAEAMGMIPPEEDKEKWWERTWTGMVFNTMLDLIPSWAVLNNDIRNFIAEHVNDIRYRLEKQQDPFLTRKDFKDSGKELYVDPNGSNYGGFSILAAPFDATREAFKTDYDEKTYTQTDENLESFSTYLTDEQTNLIYTNAIISLTAPILGSDLKTISHKITQGQLKQIKEEIKEGKDAAN